MNEIFGGLAILFIMALVGGYIAYVNHKNDSEIGVTLYRKKK